jgi:putative acetyltransferase
VVSSVQIRIANRQDEKKIVEFVEAIFSEHNSKLDLTSVDADLKNVEANYFGKDGAFLVAEHEQKIVGVAAANMIDENTCALRRIYVAKDFRRKGLASEMLSGVISILRRLDYKKLIVHDTLWDAMKADASSRKEAESFLQSARFKIAQPGSAQGSSCLELILV